VCRHSVESDQESEDLVEICTTKCLNIFLFWFSAIMRLDKYLSHLYAALALARNAAQALCHSNPWIYHPLKDLE
jgi:hypothetical protein